MKNPLHRMTIRGRMVLILALFMMPILSLGYKFSEKMTESIDFSQKEYYGVQYVRPLLTLIMEISDYQMNTQRMIVGIPNAKIQQQTSAANIDKLLEQLEQVDVTYGDILETTGEDLKKHGADDAISYKAIAAEWAALKSATTYTPTAYKKLIQHIVDLTKHVGDTSNLILDGDLDSYYLMDASISAAPAMLQYVATFKNAIYTGLHEGNGVLSEELQTKAVEEGTLLKSLYYNRIKDSILTAFNEDPNFNGVSPSLKPILEASLATFTASEDKVYANLMTLGNGTNVSAEDFYSLIDSYNDDASKISEETLGELEKMITTRVSALQQDRTKQLAIAAALVIAAYILFFVVSGSISNAVKNMTRTMKLLADGDTSVEVPSTQYDNEIGHMGQAVLVFKENMQQTEKLRLEQEQQKILAEQEKRQTMNSMADAFESSIKSVVTEVSASASQMRGNAERLNVLADETKSTSAVVASTASRAAQTATQVAAAAEELTAAIGEISAQVQKSSGVANQASQQAENINQSMHLLVEKSNRVGEVIQFITNIASQINLLALNATIESARAGEAGRGFAVVASEVKNLANQTAKATEEIVQQVQSMQEATEGAVKSVGEIISIISEISASTAGVAAAVEEQSAATNEISRNIAHTASGTNEISRSIVSVEKGADETGSSSRQVLDSAKALSAQSATLSEKVDEFLNTVRTM
ncbi:MAG: methyl-accepting chemotaxis protein [Rickettsiales bacterium]